VLLDNAATVGQVRPLLPGGGNSLTIVTSRNRLSGLAVRDGARRLPLGTLPGPEAVALLRAVTTGYRPQDDEDKLAELARLCARLPLALRIAAERAASHPHMSLDDLIADLRDESALWDALSTGSDEEADAVRTVFAWSYRALPEQAARLFRLLGLHPAAEFGLHAAAALAGLGVGRARQLLDDLVGAHLLEQTAPDRYQFHDLLRAYATDQAQTEEDPQERQAALRRTLDWYLRTAAGAQRWIRPAEAPPELPEPESAAAPLEFADYNAAVDWSEREQDTYASLVRAAVASGLDETAARLAEVSWGALPPSVSYGEWIAVGQAGLAAAERSRDRSAQTRLLLGLGMACRQVNRLDESLEHLRRALSLARTASRPFEEARALNLIGLIHLLSRQLDAAADHFAQAEPLFRAQGQARLAATALSNVANTHLDAGRLTEAATAIDRALTAHRELGNARSEANALWLLAVLHHERGEPEDALGAVTAALDIASSLRSHRLEGYWLLTLGDIQRAAGEYGDALTSFQRSAALHRRLGDRSREALAWRGTGRTYARMERHTEAADFHRRAAAVHAELGDGWEHALETDYLANAVHRHDPAEAQALWTDSLNGVSAYADPRALAVRARIERRLAAAD
jgi:tetratricopeptide (TPR) repeat protein